MAKGSVKKPVCELEINLVVPEEGPSGDPADAAEYAAGFYDTAMFIAQWTGVKIPVSELMRKRSANLERVGDSWQVAGVAGTASE